jgi:hypothetical protein
MTTKALGFKSPVGAVIAVGSTLPNPGVVGTQAWSTIAGALVQWSGSVWELVSTKVESGPEMTYVNGVLTRIDYDSGRYKIFTYNNGMLIQIDYVQGQYTTRKTFAYAGGVLSGITETTL